jgi:hypothetical protein
MTKFKFGDLKGRLRNIDADGGTIIELIAIITPTRAQFT